MKVHLVGPYYGYPYCINKALKKAAEILGWKVIITDPRSGSRHGQDWLGDIANSSADFILCSTVEGFHRAFPDPSNLPPRVLWLREEYRRRLINEYLEECHPFYDHIFYFEPSGQELIKKSLDVDTKFLPLAFDPSVHKRVDLERDLDVVFIGSLSSKEGDIYQSRSMALDLIAESGISLVAKESWDTQTNSELYSRAKIAFNLGSYWPDLGEPSEFQGVGYQNRVYEALGSAALVFNHKVTQGKLFNHKQHLVEYDRRNLIDLLKYYIEHHEEAREIADEGYRQARKKHTYRNRLLQLEKEIHV